MRRQGSFPRHPPSAPQSWKGEEGGVSTHSVGPELLLVEEASSHHLLAEGHHVRRVIQAPVLVGPELAGAAPSRLDLIHQEGTAVLEREEGEMNTRPGRPASDPRV